ncbi:MAG: hypothetical protein JO033_08255 [Acidobacteriaceae bacterium]|nr:hypothetical protein [Acidobacteriaceae bacterium]MBV9308381.1 hypothetical protein [Acidobacteriaceae bacterium]
MTTTLILQYATLLSLLIGGVSVAVAVFNHRQQLKTQIFLALSARYDELMHNSSAELWLTRTPVASSHQGSNDSTMSALRFCILFSVTYFLFLEHQIPKRMWRLILHSAERRMRNPIFVREWQELRVEFESFPGFVNLVNSVQDGTANSVVQTKRLPSRV